MENSRLNWRDAANLALTLSLKTGSDFVDSNHIASTAQLQLNEAELDAFLDYIMSRMKCSRTEAQKILNGMVQSAAADRLAKRTQRVKFYSRLSPILVVGGLLILFLVKDFFWIVPLAVLVLALIIRLKSARQYKAKKIWKNRSDIAAALDQISDVLE